MPDIPTYGIWIRTVSKWMWLQNGGIFWTTSREAAEAMLESSVFKDEGEVLAFAEMKSDRRLSSVEDEDKKQ